MLSRSQTIRWSGKGISNGRQRLIGAQSARNYSSASLHRHSVCWTRTQTRPQTFPRLCLPQSRSLSLFGWGSSKPTPDQPVPEGNASQSASLPIDQTRTVKASHATSDSPDPSLIQSIPPHSGEPAVLQELGDSISNPHGVNLPTEADIASIPERIGYLKEVCGLDFGWGPTAFMQYCFEAFHLYTGLPWATSIIAVAFIMRLALFRSVYKGQETAGRMKQVNVYMEPLREEYKKAVAANDKQQMMRVGVEMRELMRSSGVKMLDSFKPLLYQIPLQFGAFRGLRAAGDLPVPAFESESFYWITNLAMSDPWVLPLITAGSAYMLAVRSMKAGTIQANQNNMMIIFKYVLPAASFFFVRWQAAPVQIFFAAQSIFTLVQQSALQTESIRNRIGLTSLKLPTAGPGGNSGGSAGPPGGMRRRESTVIDAKAREVQSENVSKPDKFVDKVKADWESVAKSVRGRVEKRKEKLAGNEQERYEYQRRQNAQMTLDYRNRNAGQSSAYETEESEIGGMKMRRKQK